MDTSLILNFIENNTSVERYNLVLKALTLIGESSDDPIYINLENIVLTDTITTSSDKLDIIDTEINNSLRNLLLDHYMLVTTDSPLSLIMALLETVSILQHLEDYTTVQTIVYGDDDPAMIVSNLVEELTGVDSLKIMTILTVAGDKLLETIRTYVDSKIVEVPNTRPDTTNITQYLKIHGKNNILSSLLDAGISIGEPIDYYIPYITTHEYITVPDIAVNILGLMMLAQIPIDDIMSEYSKHSEVLIGDLTTITKVQSSLSHMTDVLKSELDNGQT